MNKVYTGLFDVTPTDDPFDAEVAAVTSREEAEKQFSYLVTSFPSQIANYNVLSEFVTCPSGGLGVRNLTQCVMDTNFSTAIARAESGTPLTVQQAIDEGLLNGSWALIPNEGDGVVSNQDPDCYTYGYCYSNLVKMRKARVIPVGWEIAASLNEATNPYTLQQIIDGFNLCNSDNARDETFQWCHLIDPNWVLKYPQSQCKALVNGDVQISTLTAGRAGACVDTPSCISEDNNGNCTSGYGYCTQEKNVWKFKGTECPAEAASCMIFQNTDTNAKADYLLNTVDFANCDADNAGCLWYRTQKYADDLATPDDTSDDTFEWLATGDDFVTADREDDVRKADTSTGLMVVAASYSYDTNDDSAVDFEYFNYAYQDRIYYNNDFDTCEESAAGCTAVYKINDELVLNLVQNPSFEVPETGDVDNLPDSWSDVTSSNFSNGAMAYYGDDSVFVTSSSDSPTQENLRLAANSFYTLSLHAVGTATAASASVKIGFVDAADGSAVSLAGTSSSGDCVLDATDSGYGANGSYTAALTNMSFDSTTWTEYSCTFTTADIPLNATISMSGVTGTVYFDSIQLELGEDASSFTDGYSDSSPSASYLLLPPAYLNCTGEATDAAECASYTQICTAVDVGCNLYTPNDGDPSVPAIAEALDECPSECVGYASYKQEATDRQVENFPLYFIADAATACTSDDVGCDAFTNLDSTDAGGEGSEYYTDVRACLKTSMTDSTLATKTSATYFTWEGSDAAGYQLVTWTLLQSNKSNAPCSTWSVKSESEVVCDDPATIPTNADCDAHDDIFSNPDCREFYDDTGAIAYREYSTTISISDDCHPYRFTGGDSGDCKDNGGYWTAIGDCRYFGLPEESTECTAAAAGCRSYTGGGGRNASTVYSDEFEDGALTEYTSGTTASVSVSNESVATGGRSMRVENTSATASTSVSTLVNYVKSSDPSVTYDSATATTCTDNGGTVTSTGCEVTSGTDVCTVADGDSSCGTLVGSLVDGKTYQLNFWAKGSGDITVAMIDSDGAGTSYDFVDTTNLTSTMTSLTLEGGWHEYTLGPLDTSTFAANYASTAFDDTAVISFSAGKSSVFYLDNLRLKELEDGVTVIQDSWVVPSTCDASPDGAVSPQYYLGCKAYTDQDANAANLYQFSSLCSEEVVGCEAAYNTYNSDDAFAVTYNARCAYVDSTGAEKAVGANTDCLLEGATACTIGVGDTFCLYDREGTLPSIFPSTDDGTTTNTFDLQLGPEAVAVDGDTPMYVVDNGTSSCTSDNAGCQEIGLPTFDQAKENVTSFESTFVINDPDAYSDVLCENRSLFCAEWQSTQDGNYYFKDPDTQTCEYLTNVTVDGFAYDGWFKTGTTEGCDLAYVKGGSEYGIWRNGDDEYSNWVGTCTDAYDLCTEFLDVSDTNDGNNVDGAPYNFLNDDSLSDEALTASDQCGGQVSQKFGCALFDDTTDSTLSYSTLPSYLSSTHADVLYGDAAAALVDPVSCEDGGEEFTTTEGDLVNLCNNRCKYAVADDVTLVIGNSIAATDGGEYAGACLTDSDCPDLFADDSIAYSGTCVDVTDLSADGTTTTDDTDSAAVFSDDANRVVKVYRDRECAVWSMCGQSRISWNTSTNMYDSICEQIVLCDQTSDSGDQTVCTSFPDESAVPLNPESYSARDVTWAGNEFSGYAIPGVVPVQHLTEVNIQPDTDSDICFTTNEEGVRVPELTDTGAFEGCDPGDMTQDCVELDSAACDQPASSLRLVHVAGSCDQSAGWGSECTIGYCEDDTAQTCQTSDDCGFEADGTTPVICVTSFCQAQALASPCSYDSECTDTTSSTYPGPDYPFCDTNIGGFCVDDISPSTSGCFDVSDCSGIDNACRPSASAFDGTCLNDQCLVGADGEPLILGIDSMDSDLVSTSNAEMSTCRGYPEVTSPFSPFSSTDNEPGIVEEWIKYTATPTDSVDTAGNPIYSFGGEQYTSSQANQSTVGYDAVPYTYVSGFQGQNVCAPDPTALSMDSVLTTSCDCSYTKISYGTGYTSRYYSTAEATNSNIPPALCMGGSVSGKSCTTDAECGAGGTCTPKSRSDVYNGWYGYCLERDMSINLYGNDQEHPCITWLPVDALAGATDLYGKSDEAGFPLENTYHCSETGYYVDLYPTGATMNSEGNMTTIDYACASSVDYGETETVGFGPDKNKPKPVFDSGEYNTDADYGLSDCSYGQYDGCEQNVICPQGFVGIVGYCNQYVNGEPPTSEADAGGMIGGDVCVDVGVVAADPEEEDSVETSGDGSAEKKPEPYYEADVATNWADDCPYFCVPKGSTHTQDTNADIGTRCVDEIETIFDTSGSENDYGTKYYKGGNFFQEWIPSNSDEGTLVSTLTYFADCGVRGLPYTAGEVSKVTTDGVTRTYDLDWTATQSSGEENAFASGYSVTGYPFVSNPHTGQLAYGIGYQAAGAYVEICPNTGALLSEGETCSALAAACYAFCDELPGTVLQGICDGFCARADVDPEPVNITTGSIYPYLGCYEVSQTAVDNSDSTVEAEGGTYNKAWTNRLMSSSSSFENQGQFPYTKDTAPQYVGALPFDAFYQWDDDDELVKSFNDQALSGIVETADQDAFPLPIAACDNTSETSGLVGVTTNEGSEGCEVGDYGYPGSELFDTANIGRSYEDVDSNDDELDAIDGDVGVGDTEGVGTNDGQAGILQFFEYVIRKFTYQYDTGTYDLVLGYSFDDTSVADALSVDEVGDEYGDGDDEDLGAEQRAPTIMAVGECDGTNCEEGAEGAFSVNSVDEGNVYGSAGQAYVSVSFFAFANPNQMPIRNINVDWGNSKAWRSTPEDWPDSIGGSVTEDNFYKNYRGYNQDQSGDEMCDESSWGKTSESCQTGYVTFTNSYTCTATDVERLEGRECAFTYESDGVTKTNILKQSPCTGGEIADGAGDGACVFQPRVSVLDNWGWCTGYCDGGSDGTTECYKGGADNNECEISFCPDERTTDSDCSVWNLDQTKTINPWINFNGYVIVTPP